MAFLSRTLAARCRLGLRNAASVAVRRGFRRYEHNLEWHRSVADFYQRTNVSSDYVLVASPYTYEADERETPLVRAFGGSVDTAMKYGMFHSHEELWEEIEKHRKQGQAQLFNEVLEEERPRCLYFDLDGDPAYSRFHAQVLNLLTCYVRWFFGGDQLGWHAQEPEPVVLTSCRPDKYSCHVVFPQIQFANYKQQNEYMPYLLQVAQESHVELDGGSRQYIFKNIMDKAPYKKLQHFRGPWACKLQKDGSIDMQTRMEPEEPFAGDELTYFASYVQPDYALEIPSIEQIVQMNPAVAKLMQEREATTSPSERREDTILFNPEFRSESGRSFLDLAGLTVLERYEACMERLHPDRACDWWNWFRICGVASNMLNRYYDNDLARDRIWRAHCQWSSHYPNFCEQENFEVVMKGQDSITPGIRLLIELLEHDNPGLEVREHAWPFRIGRKSQRMANELSQ